MTVSLVVFDVRRPGRSIAAAVFWILMMVLVGRLLSRDGLLGQTRTPWNNSAAPQVQLPD